MPSLNNAVVLVTGANGGLGEQFVLQTLDRGARKVYAAARNPRDWDDSRVVPLLLDVDDPRSRAAAARAADDVTALINNAGVTPSAAGYLDLPEAELRRVMETNFFSPVLLTQLIAPALRAARDGILVDIHSVASWMAFGGVYSASKAAMWSATNSLRLELAPHGVHVTGVHMGYVDTAMAEHADGPKLRPDAFVTHVLDTVEAGGYEVIGDELTASVKSGLAAPIEVLYPDLPTPASPPIR